MLVILENLYSSQERPENIYDAGPPHEFVSDE